MEVKVGNGILSLLGGLLVGCHLHLSEEASLLENTISREDILQTAQLYESFQWEGNNRNVYHGRDQHGILVNTPDQWYQDEEEYAKGWWKIGATNTGIPYKWGGFDSLSSFRKGLKKGKYAGDVFREEKRVQLGKAVSKKCIGVDCSGFVSRCWGLDRHYSTRELPKVSRTLSSLALLQAGDVLNKRNEHVVLFSHFTSPSHFVGYEALSEEVNRVRRQEFPLSFFMERKYEALSFVKITKMASSEVSQSE